MAQLMKGKVWGEHKHKLRYPVLAEIKYDEIRVHVKYGANTGVQFLSYAGKPLCNLEQFAGRFKTVMQRYGLHELDCGFEANGNFNDSYRWVRSSKGLPQDLVGVPTLFILIDAPEITGSYADRMYLLDTFVERMRVEGIVAQRPERRPCEDEAAVDRYFLEVRERGYEGLMVKTFEHEYQPGKRIDGWLKMKPEETFDGRITAINQAFALDGTPHNRAGSVSVVLEDGSTAQPAGFEWGLASDMWQNPTKYIGQWIEFKCMERDRQGGYRHPSFVRFREPKL